MHGAPENKLHTAFRDGALAEYGEGAVATPAMQTTLEGAAAACWRVVQERLPLSDAGLPARPGGALTPPTVPSGGRLAANRPNRPTTLTELTAAQAAAAIRARDLSPVALVEALLARASAVDGYLQAWERLDADGALAAARAAEQQHDGRGILHGVPLGVKDIFDTAGLRTAAGFGPYDERVPSSDAAAVAALRSAGAIILGKTVATQFAYTDPSRTRNPWSGSHTPGGSSSGSGAAVAAREVPWALGSQTAGSTLRPAAYNGAVGYKPTFGLISTSGATPLAWSLDTVGIVARDVDDCALFLAAQTGRLDVVLPGGGEQRPPHLGLLTGYVETAEPEVRAHVTEIAYRLEKAGATVVVVNPGPAYELVQAVHRVTFLSEICAAYWLLWSEHADELGPMLRAGIQVGRLLPGYVYLQAQRLRAQITAAWAAGLGGADGIDAYLLPTATNPAPGMETTGDASLQAPATLTGLPSISLPSGLTEGGLPLAIQLVGSPSGDWALLDVASWCEAQLDPFPSPPEPFAHNA